MSPLARLLPVVLPAGALLLGACGEKTATSEGGVRALTLVYQNNVNGETEPCG